jgi:3-hydroxypropanoate dehydrogenase
VRCGLPLAELDAAGRALLFTEARSANRFTDAPVGEEKLREIYDLVQYPPSQMNTNPLRILWVQSREARERLLPHMSEGNREKTATAPATAVLAADLDFHEFIPQLFPTRAHARERFGGDPELRERHARFNGAMQIGYFTLAVRAVGLAAGPMAGFDAAGVDAEFFADSTWRSLLVMNIGEPAEGAWFPERLPRLTYEQATRTV